MNATGPRDALAEKHAIPTFARVKKESRRSLSERGGNAVNGSKDGNSENGLVR